MTFPSTDFTKDSFNRQFREPLQRAKGRRDYLRENIGDMQAEKIRLDKRQKDALEARAIVQEVAQATQKKLEIHVSNVVTLAETAVFPDPYQFVIEFVQRRNKTECDLFFVKGGERMEPMASSGGGALDVAAFAMRCLVLSLRTTRPIVILDEPFRFVSVDLQGRCGEMIKAISERLGLQVLMVSHLPNIIAGADKVFKVKQQAGVSHVEEI